ncbi:MAG TPA: peptide-methionine (S)-S-oxide reductase MsrA [Gemmatimonadaceae bacterium]
MIALIASLTIAASSAGGGNQTAVLAGGCFWGVEAVFEHVKGVVRVTSGFAGGTVRSPSYEMVNSGATGHAESVEIVYDPSKISYHKILEIFFSVAHDPTQLNRQGPDEGTEYRSAIFYSDSTQKREAESYVQELTRAKVYRQPIVTQIAQLTKFYAAEDYHQDYALHNPTDPYIVYNDLPKVAHLKAKFPELYREWTQPASR